MKQIKNIIEWLESGIASETRNTTLRVSGFNGEHIEMNKNISEIMNELSIRLNAAMVKFLASFV
jgi:hypothetical protein